MIQNPFGKGFIPQFANTQYNKGNTSSGHFNYNKTFQNTTINTNPQSFISPKNFNLIVNSNLTSNNNNVINYNYQSMIHPVKSLNFNQNLNNYQNFNLNPHYHLNNYTSTSNSKFPSYQPTITSSNQNVTQPMQPKTSKTIQHSTSNSSSKQKKIRKLFSVEEDNLLTKIMYGQPFTTWIAVAEQIPGRSARQCRDRWANYLSPNNKNGPWSQSEDEILAEKHKQYGSQWTIISKFFDGRSENNVKNRWYTHLKHKYYDDDQSNNLVKNDTLNSSINTHPNNIYQCDVKISQNNSNYMVKNYQNDQIISNHPMNNINSIRTTYPISENTLFQYYQNEFSESNPTLSSSQIDHKQINKFSSSSALNNFIDDRLMNLNNNTNTHNNVINLSSNIQVPDSNPKRVHLPSISSFVSDINH